MSRSVAFLVTHLMGAGHLVRTLALARATSDLGAAAGVRVRVISGGRPLAHVAADGVELVQLPPVASDGVDYARLLDLDGRPATEALLAARRRAAAEAVAQARPDALVTETWPFGRRRLSGEFEAAVEAAGGARLWASIRDVLEPPSKPGRVAETRARLRGFAGVLVHGDAAAIPLEESWPGPAGGARPEPPPGVVYTGYVSAPAPAPSASDEVLVAVGGGVIGRRLLELAARASALSARPWRLRVGGADAAEAARRLSRLGPARVEPAAADYRARLAGAAASISLCGYNTAVETALSGTPALLVPMEEGGEQEQLIRARGFARLPGIETARIGTLTPEGLAQTAERLAARPRRPVALRADGAAAAARALLE
ncbi:MAG: glycosyltransferase, partial [Pseudomonadota bacterium]